MVCSRDVNRGMCPEGSMSQNRLTNCLFPGTLDAPAGYSEGKKRSYQCRGSVAKCCGVSVS